MSRFIRIGSNLVNLACPSLRMFEFHEVKGTYNLSATYQLYSNSYSNTVTLCRNLSQSDLNLYISRIENASQELNNSGKTTKE